MNKEFNLVEAIRIFIKWKKQIIGITVLSAVVAALFSWFFMDDYYLSFARFYPVNQALTDRSTLFNTETATNINYYGDKDDVNRVQTISNSTPVVEFLIEKYQLASHYEIETNKKYWKTKVRKKFDKNYKAIKTEQGAIEISVYDTDPKMAADMIQDALNKVDGINRENINNGKKEQLALFEQQVKDQSAKVEGYADTLAYLGKTYSISIKSGSDNSEIIDGKDYRAVQLYKTTYDKQRNSIKELNNRINIREQLEVSLKSNTASLDVIDKPLIADRKEKPVRSLICATTVFITFILALLGALMVEQIENIRKQL